MPVLSTLGAAIANVYGFTSGLIKDQYFNLVSLLLPGNGTNGAQNNTFLDSSSNNFTITRNGDTTQGTFSPFSQTGWGNYFSGTTGQYLSIADNAALQFTSRIGTIEFWVYLPTAVSVDFCGIIDKWEGGTQVGYLLDWSSSTNRGKIRFTGGSSANTISSSNTLSVGVWNHVALSIDGTNATLYINGNSQGSVNISSANLSSSGTALAINGDNASSLNNAVQYISNVRIVKGVAVYTGNFTPPISPLTTTQPSGTNIAAITGTETSLLTCQSNRFRDASTNGFTVTTNGSPSVTPFSPFAPTSSYSAAAVGGSGYFDGSGDSLQIADTTELELGASNFTIEAWIYATATPGASGATIIGKNSATYPGGYEFNLVLDNARTLSFNVYTSTLVSLQGTTVIPLNAWTHVAASRSGSDYAIYVNGTREDLDSAGGTIQSTTSNIYIGDYGGGSRNLTGYIASLRVVKGSYVYNPSSTNVTIPTAPLTAITDTKLLLNFTNAGVVDATAKNDLQTVGNAQISTAQSKWGGGSIAFDGTSDAGVIQDSPVNRIGGGKYVIEFWYYATTLPTVTYILCKTGATGTTADWAFYTTSSTTLRFGDNTSSANTITGTIASGSWQHIAASWDGTTARLYVNGTLQSSSTNSLFNNFTSTQPIIVGASTNAGANGINGYLDDVRITRGSDRGYTGSTITVPTAPFPVQ